MSIQPAAHAVSVRDLTRRFGAFVAVDRVSFDVEPGEIFGFLGSNGAGKSTVIRILCGLLQPTSGTATVGGVDVGRDPEGVKRRIGYMSQRFSLYELLTVEENITFFGGLYGLDDRRLADRRAFVLKMAGLKGRERTLTRDLAGGWRQRLALGCSILHEPRILFLDEPTGGVDPVSRRQFWRLIDQLSEEGVTVFVTTHYLDEAENCHRLALMHAGRMAALGTVQDLKAVFAGRAVVEVRTPAPMDALRALDGLASVEKTSLFGTALHVWLKAGELDTRAIERRLSERGVTADALEFVQPSLEDVFMDVVERAGGAAS
jgi:ABC-2 type transport system ATP-binding protein